MSENYADRVHPETVVLDIGQDVGALIIYTNPEMHGREIEVSPRRSAAPRTHVQVLERRIKNQPVFAAVFFGLRAGDYDIWEDPAAPSGNVVIVGGEVATVDWRERC
ncbi:MAG: phospholipase [Alphaproteobacteria bacterium]|nr:phospholipase [Alphaproteobacteria bacterium]